MIIGERLRALRAEKNLSQGDIEKRSGLLRCYISRVEHGHTVPSVETLEKICLALEVPLYQLFYEGDGVPALRKPARKAPTSQNNAIDARILTQFRRLLSQAQESDRQLLLHMARKMAGNKSSH
jgi:transcriptional regulator with XRE-family HTH domain